MPERLPQFDESAGNSEESIIAVRSIFSPKNGFKCREELADYGSDLNVELLLDGKQAWNRRFQVQVKSRASVKGDILVNSPVISYKAKVYNLNYLKQGFPVQGLFIIYDVNSQTCYFEFLINILKQLDNTYGDSWKQQENVNIHIPLRNLLTDDAAKRIHKQIVAIYTFTQDELQKRIPDLEKLIQEEEYFTENGSIQVNVFQEVTSIFRNGRELRTLTYRHKILNRIVTFEPNEHADMKIY